MPRITMSVYFLGTHTNPLRSDIDCLSQKNDALFPPYTASFADSNDEDFNLAILNPPLFIKIHMRLRSSSESVPYKDL